MFSDHPKIKVFVTQGGFQSIEEAITKGVPMVGIPFFGDQLKNIKKVVEWGLGLELSPVNMNAENLTNTIVIVATNSR